MRPSLASIITRDPGSIASRSPRSQPTYLTYIPTYLTLYVQTYNLAEETTWASAEERRGRQKCQWRREYTVVRRWCAEEGRVALHSQALRSNSCNLENVYSSLVIALPPPALLETELRCIAASHESFPDGADLSHARQTTYLTKPQTTLLTVRLRR